MSTTNSTMKATSMTGISNKTILIRVGLIILGLFALAVAPNFLYAGFLMKAMCLALFAAAFNLLLGYGGLLSFGHAAYFGTGAYVTGHAAKVWGLNPEIAILCGVLSAIALGAAFGLLAIRRQGIYFAMITLALAQMVYFAALQFPFTGGEDGLQAVPLGKLFGLFSLENPSVLYTMVSCIFIGGLTLIWRTVHSPFGQLLRAIRDNEVRAISLGYDTQRVKYVAFVISAALAGLAGSTKVLVFQLASLVDVHWAMSGEVILMTLIGGLGTLVGPVLGAVVIAAMQNYLAGVGSWVMLIQGAIFVICVIGFRRGIVGTIQDYVERRRDRDQTTNAEDL